ncbi:MAG: hypothetical protein ACK5KR_03560 [Breznakia sp.]
MKTIDFRSNEFKGFSGLNPKTKDLSGIREFKNVNIIYGPNGSGKSTLSEYFKNEYSARVFNRNYIHENVYFEDEKRYKGVKLITGETAVEANENLKKELKLKTENESEVKKLEQTNNGIEIEINELILKINKENKNGTKIQNVSTKEKAKTILKKNIKNGSLSIDYNKYDINDLVLFSEDDKFLQQNQLNIEVEENIQKILSEEYSDATFTFADYQWIKKGLTLIDDKFCPFCSNELSEDKLNQLDKYIKDETNMAKQLLRIQVKNLELINKSYFENKNKNNKHINEKTIKFHNIIELPFFEEVEALKSNIYLKLSNMDMIVDFDYEAFISKKEEVIEKNKSK